MTWKGSRRIRKVFENLNVHHAWTGKHLPKMQNICVKIIINK